MKILLNVIFCCLLLQVPALAQLNLPEPLKSRIESATNVSEAVDEIERYYNNGINLDEAEYKNYRNLQRMIYWASRRKMPDGTAGNFALMSGIALDEIEREYGQSLQVAKQQWEGYRQAKAGELLQGDSLGLNSEEVNLLSAFGAWSSLGPFSGGTMGAPANAADINGIGRGDRIAFHSTNSNIIYVGTPSGGLWRVTMNSTQTSATWVCISDNLPAQGVAGIAVHPGNGNIIYVLTGDGDSNYPGTYVFNRGYSPASQGVFRTTDGGNNWTKMADFPGVSGAYTGHKLTMSYTNGNYMFAATSQGLFRTTNGGAEWVRVRTGQHRDVEFRPGSDSVIYTSTNSTIHHSTQGGRLNTWTTSTLDFSISGATRIELAVRRNSGNNTSNYVYALVGPRVTDSTFRGVFLSTNSGASFTRRTNSPNILTSTQNGKGTSDQTQYDFCMAVKPSNVNVLLTGALIVWRSTNGGTTMLNSSTYREGHGTASQYIHPDIHDLAYSPYNEFAFAATDGGLYISKNDGESWIDLSNGKATSQFYHMKMRDTDGNGYSNTISLFAGAQDNGAKFRTTTGVYRHVACCDGFDGVISGNNGNHVYFNINDQLYRTLDGGGTIGYLRAVSFFSPISTDWNNPDTMYVGSSSLLRTYNAFTDVTTISTNAFRQVVRTAPTNSSRIYGSGGTTLVASEDRGNTRVNLHTLAGYPAGNPTVTDIQVSPLNSNVVFVTFGGYTEGVKVISVVNPFTATPSITNLSTNLPNVAVFSVCSTAEGLYVGTDIGVFVRPVGTNNWMPFFNGMPQVPVTDLSANENGNLYASTFGRGIWFSPRKSACLNDLSLTNSVSGVHFYQAAQTITSTQVTDNTVGTILNLKANNFIEFKPGFWVRAGARLQTLLSPCDAGGAGIIFMGIDPQTNQEIILPAGIEELHLKKHLPLSGAPYMRADENGVRFYLPAGGMLEIAGKMADEEEWKSLMPVFESSAGHFQLHFRESVPDQMMIRVNNSLVKEWK